MFRCLWYTGCFLTPPVDEMAGCHLIARGKAQPTHSIYRVLPLDWNLFTYEGFSSLFSFSFIPQDFCFFVLKTETFLRVTPLIPQFRRPPRFQKEVVRVTPRFSPKIQTILWETSFQKIIFSLFLRGFQDIFVGGLFYKNQISLFLRGF